MSQAEKYGLDEARADIQLTRTMMDQFNTEFGCDLLEVVLGQTPKRLDELRPSIPEVDLEELLCAAW